MAREIKFRMFQKDVKKMRYFDELTYCDEYNHLGFRLSSASREKDGGSYSNLCVGIGEFSDPMQFTGLLDKNGKEIYEGDIIRYPRIFKEDGYFVREIKWVEDDAGFDFSNFHAEACEVIGNVHENHDLLGASHAP